VKVGDQADAAIFPSVSLMKRCTGRGHAGNRPPAFDALPLPDISFEVRVPLCLPLFKPGAGSGESQIGDIGREPRLRRPDPPSRPTTLTPPGPEPIGRSRASAGRGAAVSRIEGMPSRYTDTLAVMQRRGWYPKLAVRGIRGDVRLS
jgi:hypothetical protein